MEKNAKDALVASIAKWSFVAYKNKKERGWEDCSLCDLFRENRNCEGCPVAEATGRPGCLNTPYEAWREHASAREDDDDGLYFVACQSAANRAAEEMLHFLCDLIPPPPPPDIHQEEFALPDIPGIFEGEKAVITIKKIGENMAALTVCLPTQQNKSLHPELRFEERLPFAGEFLYGVWGAIEPPKFEGKRHCKTIFEGASYREAFFMARGSFVKELKPLADALRARREKILAEKFRASIEEEIALPNLPDVFERQTALIIIKKAGLQNPAEGDNIAVEGSIKLPASRIAPKQLHAELNFGLRLAFMGKPMYGDVWGNYDPASRKIARVKKFTASTYQDAVQEARQYLHGEIEKLVAALQTRRAILLEN